MLVLHNVSSQVHLQRPQGVRGLSLALGRTTMAAAAAMTEAELRRAYTTLAQANKEDKAALREARQRHLRDVADVDRMRLQVEGTAGRERDLAASQAAQDKLEGDVGSLRGELEAAAAAAAAQQRVMRELYSKVDGLRGQVAELQAYKEEAAGVLSTAQKELRRTAKALEVSSADAAEQRRGREKAVAEGAALRRKGTELGVQLEGLRAQLAEAEGRLEVRRSSCLCPPRPGKGAASEAVAHAVAGGCRRAVRWWCW